MSVIISLLLPILLLLVSSEAKPEVTAQKTLVATIPGEYFTHVELDEANQKLKSYSNERVVEVDLTSNKLMSTTKVTNEQTLTDSVVDSSGGRIEVLLGKKCIKQYSASGQLSRELVKCSRTKLNIPTHPYGVAFKPNGEISYTDEFADQVVTLKTDGSEAIYSDASIVRPRGITYDADTNRHYVTVGNGISSLEDKTIISGIAKQEQEGYKDGDLAGAKYNHPTDIEVVRPGLLVVADYSNARIRMVDLDDNQVTSLCTRDGKCDFGYPLSVVASKDLKKIYVATDIGVMALDVEGLELEKNLCYGLSKSGLATIRLDGEKFQAWCDLDSPRGPWLNILKRYDGSVDFRQKLVTYENGFGDLAGEYWLGLEKIHLLTKSHRAMMRIDVEQKEPTIIPGTPPKGFALYEKFWIGDSSTGWTLEEISGYNGTAGDMETTGRYNTGGPHKGQKFSTYDRDLDEQPNAHCASAYNGGWWMRQCYTVCLTCGPYNKTPKRNTNAAPVYLPFTLRKVGLIRAEMKLKLPADLIVKYNKFS